MKKGLIFFILFLLPFFANAQLVPCGPGIGNVGDSLYDAQLGYIPCGFCHIFELINNILDFFFVYIVFPVAIIVVLVGGLMYMFSQGNQNILKQGKNTIVAAAMGIALIFSAWMLVNLFLSGIGYTVEWRGIGQGFFNICS